MLDVRGVCTEMLATTMTLYMWATVNFKNEGLIAEWWCVKLDFRILVV